KPPCAAKAAAPVRAGTWWSIPPAWPAFRNPRTLPNRRAGPCTTRRVRPWNTERAVRAATAVAVAIAVAVADAATAAVHAGHDGSLWPQMNADKHLVLICVHLRSSAAIYFSLMF